MCVENSLGLLMSGDDTTTHALRSHDVEFVVACFPDEQTKHLADGIKTMLVNEELQNNIIAWTSYLNR